MTQSPTSSDWAGARGDKWCAQLGSMEATLAPVDAPLFEALALDRPCRIAEVGSGGGGTALALARRAPAGSVVHGFDVSPALVEAARRRAADAGAAIAFDVADMAIAAPAEPYDRLMSRFGIMFFEDPPSAFANLARWLAPDGRFAFVVWGPPADNLWMTSVRDVVARIVAVPEVEPDAPGAFRYADAGRFVALLERAGFGDVAVRDWRGTLAIGGGLSPAGAAAFAVTAFASFGELLARAGEGALDEGRRALTEAFAAHQRDGAVRLAARVHVVTGTRAPASRQEPC